MSKPHGRQIAEHYRRLGRYRRVETDSGGQHGGAKTLCRLEATGTRREYRIMFRRRSLSVVGPVCAVLLCGLFACENGPAPGAGAGGGATGSLRMLITDRPFP